MTPQILPNEERAKNVPCRSACAVFDLIIGSFFLE